MNPDDYNRQDIAQITRMAMAEIAGPRGPKEPHGLHIRFRCPMDGSTDTQAIQGVLDALISSYEIDGKRVPVVEHSSLLRRYRIGPYPKVRDELIPISGLLFLLGLSVFFMVPGLAAFPLGFLFLASSALTLWLYRDSKKRLVDNLKRWEERRFDVMRKWHCHQCGNSFLPDLQTLEDEETDSSPSFLEQDPSAGSAIENVSPLHPNSTTH